VAQLNEVRCSIRLLDESTNGARSDVPVAGVEIDHDCATARLSAYARFLSILRARLDRTVPLSITALPAWLSAPEVDEVFSK